MVFLSILHNIIYRRLYRRTIALVQVVVMVMLAVPACCYELDNDHENASVSQTMKANNADHDKCLRNPFFLDSESGFDWTVNPEPTGHRIRF